MNYWRMNTDSEVGGQKRTFDLWYANGSAFAGDHSGNKGRHSSVFIKLCPDDGVFMHHNGLGLVGFGVVQEEWDRKNYTGLKRILYIGEQEPYEYRISVKWDQAYDCRKNPLAIHGILPYMGAYSSVNCKKWNIESILEKMRCLASAPALSL